MSQDARGVRGRIFTVMTVMALGFTGLIVQLVRVQFGPFAPVFAAAPDAGMGPEEEIAPARGMIYDRDGRLLAVNTTVYYLEVETRQLTPTSREDIPTVLAELIGLSKRDLRQQLDAYQGDEARYRVRLTYKEEEGQTLPVLVDEMQAGLLEQFLANTGAPDLSGLALVPSQKRVYPAGELAGHVLGFVNQEGDGFFGVEGYYDEWLAGNPVTQRRALIPLEASLQPDPTAGVNLVLTIDMDIQQAVEDALQDAIQWSQAESGQVLVMDPETGEMLAMAAWPRLDPNHYDTWLSSKEDQTAVIAPMVGGTYEPGSTFKVLVMSAALDSDSVELEDEFVDTGEIEVGGHTIRNWDGEAWGLQTMVGCMQHSLNVCLAHVASEDLGAGLMYSYLQAFGIGSLTGVDLAGEVSGQLRTPRHPGWTEADLGTNSFGQGVAVTPVQLIAAVGAVANEGVMVQPHVVRQVVGPQGVYWPKTTVLGRPISPETAHEMTGMLVQALEGETRLIDISGYSLAGKTGTASIPTEHGYDPNLTIASYIGWGPVEDPRFVILVRLDKPKISPWGSAVAAPLFAEIAERLVIQLEIPPASASSLTDA